jgi:mRNA interferase RelE/StbE
MRPARPTGRLPRYLGIRAAWPAPEHALSSHILDPFMRYCLFLSEEARDQLRALSPEIRRNLGHRIDQLQTDLTGDVKKLSGREGKYRLRVGSFRLLFELQGNVIFIYAVKDRKEAYD